MLPPQTEAMLQRQRRAALILLRNRVQNRPRCVTRHLQLQRLKRGNDNNFVAAAPEIMRCSQNTQGQEESCCGGGRSSRRGDG